TEAERTITTPDSPDEAADTGARAPDAAAPADSGAQAAPDAPARSRRVPVLIAVAALAYLLDVLSKLWVVHSLEHRDPIRLLGHYLQLDATRNAGAAFGMGQGMTIVFTLIAVGVIAVIVRLSRRLYSTPWAIALGLLLGGAFGNLTDRVFRSPGGFQGRVVDFIAPEHFAIFNLADSAICCGGALIVLLSFRGVDPDGSRHQD
ncbi:MAG: signal peptidase II, partial [Actinomycetia bacterium]|nr:signal peptidase II [Actinomycetes bacterium]